MRTLYNIVIFFYCVLLYLIAPFNEKASLWIKGRKGWKKRLLDKVSPDNRNIWIHCSSLGEFEQGRPVMEAMKREHPELKIILTFYSPSGYENRKDYSEADYVCYMPVDFKRNARDFVRIVNPAFVIFVKYEFWNNFITEIHNRHIPLYIISAIFRPGQHFFKWYGAFFRDMLKKIDRIFVQDQRSVDLLEGIGIGTAKLSGDTRFDRVVKISGTAVDIPELQQFRGNEKLFIAGSSWRRDEEIITQYIRKYPLRMKWVFAPHEIDKSNIERLEKLIDGNAMRFSEFTGESVDARVLILDNIGMLSSAYKYAHIAEVGGGFGSGIHNILEPACWKIPVLFGPNHEDYKEAIDLLDENGAMTFDSFEGFSEIIDRLLSDENYYLNSAAKAGDYITRNKGATARILDDILR
jgi:3-deoxy-D-manno-octulosonic-acid transferase